MWSFMEGHKLTGENVTHLLCLFFFFFFFGICTWYSHVTLLTLLLTNDLHLMVVRLPLYSQRPQPHFGLVHGFESDIRFKACFYSASGWYQYLGIRKLTHPLYCMLHVIFRAFSVISLFMKSELCFVRAGHNQHNNRRKQFCHCGGGFSWLDWW